MLPLAAQLVTAVINFPVQTTSRTLIRSNSCRACPDTTFSRCLEDFELFSRETKVFLSAHVRFKTPRAFDSKDVSAVAFFEVSS